MPKTTIPIYVPVLTYEESPQERRPNRVDYNIRMLNPALSRGQAVSEVRKAHTDSSLKCSKLKVLDSDSDTGADTFWWTERRHHINNVEVTAKIEVVEFPLAGLDTSDLVAVVTANEYTELRGRMTGCKLLGAFPEGDMTLAARLRASAANEARRELEEAGIPVCVNLVGRVDLVYVKERVADRESLSKDDLLCVFSVRYLRLKTSPLELLAYQAHVPDASAAAAT